MKSQPAIWKRSLELRVESRDTAVECASHTCDATDAQNPATQLRTNYAGANKMDFNDVMLSRNADFANTTFDRELKMMPSTGTVVVGCVDPRVDPAKVLGLQQGEAAVIRNVGGRVNKPLLETLAVLSVVAKAAGRPDGARNLVLLQHTDCGIIGCHTHAPALLAKHLGVETAALDELAITEPYEAVELDVAALRANKELPDNLIVSGLVYDVKTGLIETVVPPAPLRRAAG
jgi:carbonic anhydrase